jgi:hypothetical protein
MVSSVATAITSPSRRSTFVGHSTGCTSAVTPRMRSRFETLEPTTLPTAIPGAPASAALTLVTSSGAEVPNPTSVTPMTSGDIPSRLATATEPRTRPSPPSNRSTRPPRISR